MIQLKKLVCLMLALALLPLSAALAEEESYFTARDLAQDYDANKAAMIQLLDSKIAAGTESVTVSGTTATITAEGVYVLTGTLQNGQIIVDAPKDAKVQLVLDGVTIHSETSAAIYVRQADKVFLTLAAGTENNLSSGDAFEAIDDNNIDAAVFSKDTLTINGAGALTVASPAGHGVAVKGKLKITGGSVRITAARHGATGKNGVYICGGTLDITAEQDGMHAENDEDTTRGWCLSAAAACALRRMETALTRAARWKSRTAILISSRAAAARMRPLIRRSAGTAAGSAGRIVRATPHRILPAPRD